jgi:hypothetical protein
VLLITDGAIWDIDEMFRTALDTGHRVFCVGVGAEPVSSLLSQLAEQTGGACVFVTPNENMSEPIQRLMHRMRLGQTASLQVKWSQPMEWTSDLPSLLIPGETVSMLGISKNKGGKVGKSQEPLHAELVWAVDAEGEQASGTIHAEASETAHPDMARLAFHHRIHTEKKDQRNTTWALEQQLLSSETKMILVHVREEGDKATGLPRLHQVEQMLPIKKINMSMSVASVWRSRDRTSAAMKVDVLSSGSMDDFEIPAFLRKGEDALPVQKLEPVRQRTSDLRKMREEMLKRFDELATHESDTVLVWSRFIQGTQATDSIKALLKDIQALGIDENTSWALLLQWLNNFTMEFEILSRYGRRMLIMTRKHLDEETTHRAYELCLSEWE